MLKRLFPRASRYDKSWVLQNSLGENVLYNVESVCKVLDLKPGMKVLDLGCGKAISAIFLAKEFGCQVWAVDSSVAKKENERRIRQAGCTGKVTPVQADAKKLPFEKEFFDVIIAVDSYLYYGCNKRYLHYITKFLKPGGSIAVVDACLTRSGFALSKIPRSLRMAFKTIFRKLHTVAWWKKLWKSSGLMVIERAEILPENRVILKEFVKDHRYSEESEVVRLLERDRRGLIGLFRMVGRYHLTP